MHLENLIKTKKAKVAIIGMGYVGLPHAVLLAKAGFKVVGIDVQKEKVNGLNRGKSHIGDISDEELKLVIKAKKFKASNNFESLKSAEVVIICVPTPLDKNKLPDMSYIESAVREIKPRLHKNQLIVLESTTYPGTTEEVILPQLQGKNFKVDRDFYLAFAPERIDPGNTMPSSKVPKVVGGVTKECTKLATLFYSQFIEKVFPVSSARTAEMTKIVENTFRLVNIASINELSLFCGKMGIDVWEVIEAASTKPYGFMPFYPSPKAGGHCIPLDPFYLSYKGKELGFWSRFIELAGEINEQMPHIVMTKAIWVLNLKAKSVRNAKVLVWGVSYKKDIPDTRESAAFDILADLTRKGAKVDYFDPFVPQLKVKHRILKNKTISLKSVKYSPETLKKYDLIMILTDHSGFDYEKLAQNSRLVVDTRNAIKSRKYKHVFRL